MCLMYVAAVWRFKHNTSLFLKNIFDNLSLLQDDLELSYKISDLNFQIYDQIPIVDFSSVSPRAHLVIHCAYLDSDQIINCIYRKQLSNSKYC